MMSQTSAAAKTATVIALLATGFTAGCSSKPESPIPLSNVKGVVSYQGQPLETGTISFMPINGTNTASGEIVNGEYSLSTFTAGDGAPAGQYKVAVTAWSKMPEMGVEGVPSVPRKYLDPKQSGLTATISQEKSQTIDFQLQPE
jgi:hypothetical protein